MACVSAALPDRQQYILSVMCVSLSVTRFAIYELQNNYIIKVWFSDNTQNFQL